MADLAENLDPPSSSKIELVRNTRPFPQGFLALHGARRVLECAGMKEHISSWRPWAYAAWTLRAYGPRTPVNSRPGRVIFPSYSGMLWEEHPHRPTGAWFCFLNRQPQHHRFGPRENEHCVRWKHLTFRQRGKSTTARI